MKRHMMAIAMLMLIGAVTNILVAWIPGWEYTARWPTRTEPLSEVNAREAWTAYAPPAWPDEYVPIEREIGVLGTYESVRNHPDVTIATHHLVRRRRGWPCRSLESAGLVEPGGYRIVAGVEVPIISSDRQSCRYLLLSFRPLPLGFIVNTAFHAFLLWLPICGPFALRRFIRARRGRCLKCGYPAGGSEMCTECGTPVPVRWQQA